MDFRKDPQAVLDYQWDWSAWLPEGDTIVDHDVEVVTGDVEIDSSEHNDTAVIAWISGGSPDSRATVTAHITTDAGRQDDRTIRLTIRDR